MGVAAETASGGSEASSVRTQGVGSLEAEAKDRVERIISALEQD
jgi:hypothetical protein